MTIPWNPSDALPSSPEWSYMLTARIQPDAGRFSIWPYSVVCTKQIFHYPQPLGDKPQEPFCLTTSQASFVDQRVLFDPLTFEIQHGAAEYVGSVQEKIELEYHFQADPATVPTELTEG